MHTPTNSSITGLATHSSTTGLATHPPLSHHRLTDARQTTFHTPQPNWGVAPGWPTRHLQKRQLHVHMGGVRCGTRGGGDGWATAVAAITPTRGARAKCGRSVDRNDVVFQHGRRPPYLFNALTPITSPYLRIELSMPFSNTSAGTHARNGWQ
eukprot:scaffold22029_cov117-Isochrysis_galbana.AAC.3